MTGSHKHWQECVIWEFGDSAGQLRQGSDLGAAHGPGSQAAEHIGPDILLNPQIYEFLSSQMLLGLQGSL